MGSTSTGSLYCGGDRAVRDRRVWFAPFAFGPAWGGWLGSTVRRAKARMGRAMVWILSPVSFSPGFWPIITVSWCHQAGVGCARLVLSVARFTAMPFLSAAMFEGRPIATLRDRRRVFGWVSLVVMGG